MIPAAARHIGGMSKALYTPAIERYNTRQIYGLLSGTSRRGTLSGATLEDIERAFGKSHLPSMDDKVEHEWVFIDNQTNQLVTLYGYKGDDATRTEWSIGGRAHPVVFEVWAKRQIAAYRRRAKKMAAAPRTVYDHLEANAI